MREYITVDIKANEIRLMRETSKKTFLLIEGRSDEKFYKRFVHQTCELITVSGKPSSKERVIAVLKILERANFQGVLAIVDADFDHLENSPHNSPNLMRTDTHDLETMLLKSLAFDKVIIELGSEKKIKKFGRDIKTALLEVGKSIGYLRWISQTEQLNLKFEGITFSKFIDEKKLQINELKLIQEIKNKSQVFNLKDEDIQTRLNNKKNSSHDPWQVCCGHDLVEILSFSLRKTFGSVTVKTDDLEVSLRLAYETAYFCETQLYLSIRIWETSNKSFKVLHL